MRRLPLGPALIAALAALALAPAAASADTILVDTTNDEFGENAGLCSLREAVETANHDVNFGGCVRTASPGTLDVVLLPGGAVYSLERPGLDNDNSGGDLDVIDDLGIGAISLPPPVIRIVGNDRVIDVPPSAGDVRLVLGDLSITNGHAIGIGEDGGAIRIAASGGSLAAEGITVSNSHAAGYGGAISIEDTSASEALVLVDSELTGNSAAYHGGAIYFSSTNASPQARIQNTTLSGNSSGGAGGAIYFVGDPQDEVTLHLTNSTVSGNSAAQGGGGIGMGNLPAELHATFSTIASNTTPTALRGGGIQTDNDNHRVFLHATILAYNTAAGAARDCARVLPGTPGFEVWEHSYNLASTNTCHLQAGAPSHDLIGVDPLLAPLAENGGPTRTRGLYDGSPAHDHVPGAVCEELLDPDPIDGPRDQRGVNRTAGEDPALCDIGAFEGSVGPVPQPPPPPSTTDLDAFRACAARATRAHRRNVRRANRIVRNAAPGAAKRQARRRARRIKRRSAARRRQATRRCRALFL